VYLKGPEVYLKGPQVYLKGPEVYLKGPEVYLKIPEVYLKGPDVYMIDGSGCKFPKELLSPQGFEILYQKLPELNTTKFMLKSCI